MSCPSSRGSRRTQLRTKKDIADILNEKPEGKEDLENSQQVLTGTAVAGKVAKDIQAFMTQALDSKLCTGAPARSSGVGQCNTSFAHKSLCTYIS